jgi:hypothetical protein
MRVVRDGVSTLRRTLRWSHQAMIVLCRCIWSGLIWSMGINMTWDCMCWWLQVCWLWKQNNINFFFFFILFECMFIIYSLIVHLFIIYLFVMFQFNLSASICTSWGSSAFARRSISHPRMRISNIRLCI